ncbi:MAG: VWA domain-containing protein [Planctomycetes bacterium]|nr:VWA domain-containing protein [Planctomycetota bacterium]
MNIFAELFFDLSGVQCSHPNVLALGTALAVVICVWSLWIGRASSSALLALLGRSAVCVGLAVLAAEPQIEFVTEVPTQLLLLGGRELPEGAVRHERFNALVADSSSAFWLPPQATPLDLNDTVQVAALLPNAAACQTVVALDGIEGLRQNEAMRSLHACVLPAHVRAAPPYSGLELQVSAAATPATNLPARLRGHARIEGPASLRVLVDGQVVEEREVFLAPGAFDVPLTELMLTQGYHSVVALIGSGAAQRAAVATVEAASAALVAVVCAEPAPWSMSALQAQGREVVHVSPAELGSSSVARQARTLVLDRVSATQLSQTDTLAVLRQRAVRGLGWVYLPAEAHGDLGTESAAPFAALLPAQEREAQVTPPPLPDPPPDEKPDELQPADPAKRTREMRNVPTLGLVVAIDASGSMQGEPMRLAKEAAWAAVQVLHPEDFVGVIAFNKEAKELLSLTKAGDKDTVKDRIARIQCGGGTDFSSALELAEEIFAEEKFSVRHLILLSDGESEPGRFEAITQRLVRAGITVSTVGCGPALNVRDLSNIAAHGGGKFYPAYSLKEVPEIFTIEAERVIARSGARRAPPNTVPTPLAPQPVSKPEPTPELPKPAKPPEIAPLRQVRRVAEVALLQGVDCTRIPGVSDLIRLHATDTGTVALSADEDPLLVQGQYGAARVVQFAVPFEGAFAANWSSSSTAQVLLAQATAWCEGRDAAERARLSAITSGRSVLWRGEDLFERHPDHSSATFTVQTPAGALGEQTTSMAELQWQSLASPSESAPVLFGTLRLQRDGAVAHAAALLPTSAQRTCALPHPQGLDHWAAALGAEIALVPPQRSTQRFIGHSAHASGEWLAAVAALAFAVALALERVAPTALIREKKV